MRYTLLISLRVLLLVLNIFLLTWIFGDTRLFFNQIIISLLLVIQVAELIRFVNHTNRELTRFFLAIRYQDFSVTFNQPPLNRSFNDLQNSMTEIMRSFKQVKIEKEAQFHFLQMLVNQLHVGIISLRDDDVVLINPTAEQLLKGEGLKSWKQILQLNPTFAKDFSEMQPQDRKLIEITIKNETKILAVEVTALTILDHQNTLITLQDINTEIEQKEIEAWHKLIRILTHEIMNSVTPISSLTETMQSMLGPGDNGLKPTTPLKEATIADLRFALNTIQHRSEGLLHFVENYRKLTRVPTPALEPIHVARFLAGIETLMQETLQRKGITFEVVVNDKTLTALMDPALMEQVFINLITNSAHALEDKRETKIIKINTYPLERQIVFEITDNGVGINEKELKEIFIPFFSTKKEGSGIGLSLSKQIISLHKGSIKVSSVPGMETTFYINLRAH